MAGMLRVADAALGAFTVGEQAWQGRKGRAIALGLTLAIPLLWKRRLATLTLALVVGALAYYFADELHEREAIVVPVEPFDAPAAN